MQDIGTKGRRTILAAIGMALLRVGSRIRVRLYSGKEVEAEITATPRA
jgi:hypothetical protein